MNSLLNLFLLALLGSIIALAGGVVFLYKRSWAKFLEKHSLPFAAGVLITVSLVGLLPEAVEVIEKDAFYVVLVTFFASYLFEQVFFGIHHHKESGHDHLSGSVALVIVGDTLHNFIDGVAIGASFFVSPGLGLITALSTFLHEIPHEIGDFGVLLKAGWSRKKVLLVNFVSASMTIVGAFVLVLFANDMSFVGYLLAVASGIFLYLGASDFLPHISKEYDNKFMSILPLSLGVVIMLGTFLAIPHGHEDEDHQVVVEENQSR